MPKSRYSLATTLKIGMDDLAFNNDKRITLITEGVTTCIAFIIRGQYWLNDDLVSFCGLYHWPGFNTLAFQPNEMITKVLDYFFYSMRKELPVFEDSIIDITELVFIGGEKRQLNTKGELLLSGTEKEVIALIHVSKHYNYEKHSIKIRIEDITHQHYLTFNNLSLLIKVHPDSWAYDLQQEIDVDDVRELETKPSGSVYFSGY